MISFGWLRSTVTYRVLWETVQKLSDFLIVIMLELPSRPNDAFFECERLLRYQEFVELIQHSSLVARIFHGVF